MLRLVRDIPGRASISLAMVGVVSDVSQPVWVIRWVIDVSVVWVMCSPGLLVKRLSRCACTGTQLITDKWRSTIATMQDVARAAGVSMMTVSNVINGHPNVRVETKAKVLQAIAELDYRVNVAARNLRAGRTRTIGLAVAEVDSSYYAQLGARIIAEAALLNFRVVIEQTGASREKELDALFLSSNRLYDGLILSTVGLGAADADLLRVDYPVVILGERIFNSPVDHIAMPNVDGARAATEHLIAQGCRRIGFIGGLDLDEPNVSSLRHSGYRQALAAPGVEYDPDLLVESRGLSLARGAAAARALLASKVPFDGLFCVTDSVALGALRSLADAEVNVPGQVKVIGFDDIEESAYSFPSLSSINPDHDWMAKTAVERLVGRISQTEGAEDPVELVSGFQLVGRESTAQSQ
ncbi:LacI family DNA-binding transcriptional regulator [Arthrobacter sp. H5]|uniref:LacI family DNA-binding transcriptional regulator n=1 Tax=Arthrobacter sp. H5 TaxID=1267973 RepID=UPI0020A6D6B1|nr:LacI family DNA-binding transcriptional regulator [Arthrobacter sp. H5]